eukprot:746147-Pelagomonas_calceolata.AAC.1
MSSTHNYRRCNLYVAFPPTWLSRPGRQKGSYSNDQSPPLSLTQGLALVPALGHRLFEWLAKAPTRLGFWTAS